MTYADIKNAAFHDELTKLAFSPTEAVMAAAEIAPHIPTSGRNLISRIGSGISGTASEIGSNLATFAKHPIDTSAENLKEMLFGGLKPGAGMVEKALFNPVTQGYFLGYLPLKGAYDIASKDSKHKGEEWGNWAGTQAGMLAVPMTSGFAPAVATSIGMALAGKKAGELWDNLWNKKKELSNRMSNQITAQLPTSELPTY